uniref:zinc ribbon domain-containing protein n=1 Tax=Okeania sp. SIO2F4 TaxID=2607790 RepID=UPI00342217E2
MFLECLKSGATPRRRKSQAVGTRRGFLAMGMPTKRGNAHQETVNYPELFLMRGWRTFRTFLDGIAEKYGRDFRIISRWEPTSQKCSCCGFKGGKLDLSVREWECLNCGSKHDRDENAARNILVAGGQSETKNGRGGKHKTTVKVAEVSETSTRRGAMAR